MPTYEYRCEACDHQFEEFQSINAEPLKKCPKCKKKKLRRAFGIGAAVLFKGSGFYQTDYRSQSYQAAAQADQNQAAAKADSASADSSAPAASTGKSESSNGATSNNGVKSGEKSSKSKA